MFIPSTQAHLSQLDTLGPVSEYADSSPSGLAGNSLNHLNQPSQMQPLSTWDTTLNSRAITLLNAITDLVPQLLKLANSTHQHLIIMPPFTTTYQCRPSKIFKIQPSLTLLNNIYLIMATMFLFQQLLDILHLCH